MSKSQNGQLNLFVHFPPVADISPATPEGIGGGAVAPARPTGAKPKLPPPARHTVTAHAATDEPAQPCLSDVAVAKRYGVSRPTIWRWAKTLQGFPQPARISGGTTRWWLAELQAFDHTRMEPRDQPGRGKGQGGAT